MGFESWLEAIWYPRLGEGPLRRLALAPLAWAELGWKVANRWKDRRYNQGWARARSVEGLKVLSVGNLTVGGSGKTPVVAFLARRLSSRGGCVAILSRGHGRKGSEDFAFDHAWMPPVRQVGDEPWLLAKACPGSRIYVGLDRVRLAERAKADGCTVAILDDGMQQRRLVKDVELVVIDEEAGFGNRRLLPRGPLREAPSALARAKLLWIRSSPRANSSAAWRTDLPDRPIVRARHLASGLLDPAGRSHPLAALSGRRLLALAGIARPARFVQTLIDQGACVVETAFFGDHHWFSSRELKEIERRSSQGALTIVTTEKDRVRLPAGFPAWAVGLEIEVEEGIEHLDRALASLS